MPGRFRAVPSTSQSAFGAELAAVRGIGGIQHLHWYEIGDAVGVGVNLQWIGCGYPLLAVEQSVAITVGVERIGSGYVFRAVC